MYVYAYNMYIYMYVYTGVDVCVHVVVLWRAMPAMCDLPNRPESCYCDSLTHLARPALRCLQSHDSDYRFPRGLRYLIWKDLELRYEIHYCFWDLVPQ